MPTISYAVTACNEHRELSLLLEVLRNNIRQEDEIVVQLDSNATQEVREVAKDYIEFPLNKDFASFKQNLIKHCTKEYIFQIDADEYPHPHLIANLADILQHNQTIDVFLVPRINTVSGLTEEHIQKWGWNVDAEGRVNFPDYQWRIWKNKSSIKWINKVHERLDGFTEYSPLPASSEYCLFHPKDIERQEKQNQFYNTI
jgi:glycosyltransferase involved in cell wall biosynthesis